ncbi:hypothetical protein EV200_109154 [Pedobacter psychrotolerans]|uniref:Uncharacterized protein n=1 Tax=Pedobacter psychrotolerans TaxID=1843235 RepID=A0A4R2H3Q6_9SPHI|nr:hypothetical protein [Pedobacter psychrotolerans]TCO19970.1 hypothetical protein EV200_109154 [Pedobacter psychrotolerans]GGE50191.1 hypothetical protein GCM10011413_15510 [Pedobacter psychrotolerans]
MRNIQAKDTLFFYSPNMEDLTLYAGVKFSYNFKTRQFQLDMNPDGESRLTDIRNFKVNETFTQIEFDINYKNKAIAYTLSSDFDTCKYAFEIITNLNESIIPDHDLDKVDLYFEQDVLTHLYVSKTKEYQLIDSLRLISENNNCYLIRNKPEYNKKRVDDILVQNGKVLITAEGKDVFFEFNLSPVVYKIIENMLRLKK